MYNLLILFILCYAAQIQALQIDSYYGEYNAAQKKPGRVSESLTGPLVEDWKSPEKVATPYTIGVLVPHLKNKYWLSINWSIIEQAKNLGVNIKLYSAGGYQKGGVQRRQLTNDLIKDKVDGIIIGTIFYDKLDRFIAQVEKLGIPVIAMVNDILAPTIRGKVMVSYYDVGYHIGKYVIQDANGEDLRIAFFPGPEKSQWGPDTFDGFIQAIKDNPLALPLGKVTVVAKQFGDMDHKQQSQLIDFVLQAKENIHYIIANSMAAQVAPNILNKYKKGHPRTKIISTYITPELFALIKDQFIYAAATDLMIEQAKISIDMMVRILNGETPGLEETKLPFRVSPHIKMIDKTNIKVVPYQRIFGQDDFKPIFQYLANDE